MRRRSRRRWRTKNSVRWTWRCNGRNQTDDARRHRKHGIQFASPSIQFASSKFFLSAATALKPKQVERNIERSDGWACERVRVILCSYVWAALGSPTQSKTQRQLTCSQLLLSDENHPQQTGEQTFDALYSLSLRRLFCFVVCGEFAQTTPIG